MPLVANWPGATPGLFEQPSAVPPGQSIAPPPPDGFQGSYVPKPRVAIGESRCA